MYMYICDIYTHHKRIVSASETADRHRRYNTRDVLYTTHSIAKTRGYIRDAIAYKP